MAFNLTNSSNLDSLKDRIELNDYTGITWEIYALTKSGELPQGSDTKANKLKEEELKQFAQSLIS